MTTGTETTDVKRQTTAGSGSGGIDKSKKEWKKAFSLSPSESGGSEGSFSLRSLGLRAFGREGGGDARSGVGELMKLHKKHDAWIGGGIVRRQRERGRGRAREAGGMKDKVEEDFMNVTIVKPREYLCFYL